MNICLTILLLAICGHLEASWRQYEQVHRPAKAATQASSDMSKQLSPELIESAGQSAWTWRTPQGWTEQKGSGMRLVAFEQGSMSCTVISLKGSAGGLKANFQRWLGQLNSPVSEAELERLIQSLQSIESADRKQGLWQNLTPWLSDQAQSSMIVGVFELPSEVLFIKLGAPRSEIADYQQPFIELCRSLKQSAGA